jgi:hypothetical protein
LAGLDDLARRKRASEGSNVFKPPLPKVAVAASSVDEDEKPGPAENEAKSLSTVGRSNSSRRYRGSASDDKTSSNGASYSLNKIHEFLLAVGLRGRAAAPAALWCGQVPISGAQLLTAGE